MAKWQSSAVKYLTIVVMALVVTNIMIIAHFQHDSSRETTVIFSKVLKDSDELSDSDKKRLKDEIIRSLNARKEQEQNPKNTELENDNGVQPIQSPENLKSFGENGRSALKGPSKAGEVILTKTSDTAEEYDMKDDDIDAMIRKLASNSYKFFPINYERMSLFNLTRQLGALKRKTAKQLEYYAKNPSKSGDPAWKRAHRGIRKYSLYDPDDPSIDAVLKDMVTQKITETDENDGGTEFKLTLTLKNGARAIMKPMRWPREVEANPNHYIFDDMERHIAEIAAFQLDRILGFFRAPPTIGRKINITSELKPLMPKAVYKTVHFSPSGNVCFYGECDYYCDSAHAFCGNPDTIEVSMMSYLPSRNVASRDSWYQPYQRSYSKFRKAYWEKHDDLCVKLKKEYPYSNGKLLADMIDAHTFDFLTGNKDRHSFLFFEEFGNYSFPIMYDNGRGFGRKTYDAMSILAPLRQCCMIRKSTLLKYIKLYQGPDKLSDLMEKALANDPVAPVLLRGHLTALDRRLLKILRTVATCLKKHTIPTVAIDDRF